MGYPPTPWGLQRSRFKPRGLVLRPFSFGDASEAHRVFCDAEVMWFAAGQPDSDVEATRGRLERYVAHHAYGFSKWGAWSRDSATYFGDSGLMVLSETGEVELGYRLARDYWGQGLATELALAWLNHGLDVLELPRIIGFADPRNAASVRVMEKIGMSFDRNDRLGGMECVVYEATR